MNICSAVVELLHAENRQDMEKPIEVILQFSLQMRQKL
jgi:hypothetical protein